jgi:DNA-binding transcriptional regulator YdaS (Cro superfamily)
MSNPAEILRSFRERKRQTKAEFAALLGIPEPTYRSLENGWRPITPKRAKEIEEKLGGALTRDKLCPDLFADMPKRRRATA